MQYVGWSMFCVKESCDAYRCVKNVLSLNWSCKACDLSYIWYV